MADQAQVKVLRQGAEVWAAWRKRHLKANLDLTGADLTKASLFGALLCEARLYEARLCEANLVVAKLDEANLFGADLARANLANADLRQASLIDARLDGAILTDARLWETQRTGWSIKGVVCQRVYWDREGKEPTEYGDGEFERLYTERPRLKLRYPGGMAQADLLMLPLVIQRLQDEHPGSALHVRSIQEDSGGAVVMITVEDRTDRKPEVVAREIELLQNKLLWVEAERDRLLDRLAPRLLDTVVTPMNMTIIGQVIGRAAIGGPMSGDTFNTMAGQVGAVGPKAHVHDTTFQQVQGGGLDLPRLVHELGRLRTAMKGEAEGSPEQDEAVGAAAAAEKAAKQGDESAVLRHLKKAGTWTLGVAEKVTEKASVALAVEVLKRALG